MKGIKINKHSGITGGVISTTSALVFLEPHISSSSRDIKSVVRPALSKAQLALPLPSSGNKCSPSSASLLHQSYLRFVTPSPYLPSLPRTHFPPFFPLLLPLIFSLASSPFPSLTPGLQLPHPDTFRPKARPSSPRRRLPPSSPGRKLDGTAAGGSPWWRRGG